MLVFGGSIKIPPKEAVMLQFKSMDSAQEIAEPVTREITGMLQSGISSSVFAVFKLSGIFCVSFFGNLIV